MKKFENIVIASDLDGTYFGSKQYIIPRNIERVKYFVENGGHFTFATGRLPLFLKKPIPDPENHINMPAVLGNGTCIYDYNLQKTMDESFVDSALIIEMIAFVRSVVSGIGFRGVFPEGVVVSDLENPIIRGEFERFPPYINKQVLPASEWGDFKLYKTNVMGDERDIDMIYPLLKEKYGERIGVTRSASFMVELVPKGVTKAVALKELVESYFDRPMTLCCVGDYDNDIEMLEAADISACPENANDNVKALAKLHLCSNDDGVIGDLIDWLDKNI